MAVAADDCGQCTGPHTLTSGFNERRGQLHSDRARSLQGETIEGGWTSVHAMQHDDEVVAARLISGFVRTWRFGKLIGTFKR
jgi:hypothetical protein